MQPKSFKEWLATTHKGDCTDRMPEKASAYILVVFVLCIVMLRLSGRDIVPVCTALAPAALTIDVFALACTIKSLQLRKCRWYISLASIVSHCLPVLFCICNSSATRLSDYMTSMYVLVGIFVMYALMDTWPYPQSPRTALLIAPCVMLFHAATVR